MVRTCAKLASSTGAAAETGRSCGMDMAGLWRGWKPAGSTTIQDICMKLAAQHKLPAQLPDSGSIGWHGRSPPGQTGCTPPRTTDMTIKQLLNQCEGAKRPVRADKMAYDGPVRRGLGQPCDGRQDGGGSPQRRTQQISNDRCNT